MGLLTPGFLIAGVLLAGIPIAIHLLNRRRYKEQAWAAMEFLLRAVKENRKRLRFERWVLLAMRCLVLALLGLALARPVGCEGDALSALAKQSGLTVLVIDNSYSMGYEANRPEAATHLDQAKKLARQALDRLSTGGDSVAIVTASAPAKVVFPAGYDMEAARAAIERIDQTWLATDLAGAVKAAEQVARDSAGVPMKSIRIFSDGTRSSLADAIKEPASELPKVFNQVAFQHLGLGTQRHASLVDLGVDGTLITARQGSRVVGKARAFGGEEVRQVRWTLDGQALAGGGDVKVGEDETALRLDNVKFGRAGVRVLAAELVGEDRLKADVIRRQVVQVADRAKVLIVEGDRGQGPLGSSGAFLKLALSPPPEDSGLGASRSPLEAEAVSDLELAGKVLTDYRAIVLAGVGQIPEGVADSLKAYVEGGGALVMFMGEGVSMENYNAVMLSRGLMPGSLVKRVSAGSDGKGFTFDFNPLGNLHPMLSVLAGETKSGLDTALTTTYIQAEVGPKVERVLDFASGAAAGEGHKGDPAITTHSLGNGRVVFMATSAGADNWTAINAKYVFVTLVQEMIGTSVPAAGGWMNVVAGQKLELPAKVKLVGAPTLTDEAGRTLAMVSETDSGGRVVWRSEPLTRPGVYLVSGAKLSEIDSGTLPVAVNVDAANEADVRTVDEAGIRRAFGDVEMEVLRDALPPEKSAEASKGADYGWAVLVILLIGLGVESFLAMKFGHAKRPTAGVAGVAA